MTQDGGPAFPKPGRANRLGDRVEEPQEGMSLRDWFATHAPEVPDWFEPVTETVIPEYPSPFAPHQADLYAAKIREYGRARNCVAMERIAQWGWHYADAMLKARGQ